MKIIVAFIALVFCSVAFAEPVELAVNYNKVTKHQLKLNDENFEQYRDIAKSIGLEYDREYSYTKFADIAHENEIGAAGEYDFLLLSTGGSSWNAEDDMKFSKAPLGWEMIYYSNHDITVIKEVRKVGDYAFIKLLKLAKGKQPDLHNK